MKTGPEHNAPPESMHEIQPVKKSPGRRKSVTFAGSYEESLLSGRMSSPSSSPVRFNARVGVVGKNSECPAHVATSFEAVYYDWGLHDNPQGSTPYVGHIDVEQLVQDSNQYRIPRHGQIQIIVSNLQGTPVHLFLIPYNMQDMPSESRTFLRHKVYEVAEVKGETRTTLAYAAHIPVACPRRSKVYMTGELRLVFQNRRLSLDQTVSRVENLNGGYSHIGISPHLSSALHFH